MNEAKPPIVVVAERVDRLEGEKVTYRAATIVSTNPGQRLIDVDVENAGKLEGLRIPEGSFFPRVGDEGAIQLQGSRVSWVANRLGIGVVGEEELAPPVIEKINVTLETANGKNSVTYSEDPPDDVASPGTKVGDIYWQLRPPVSAGDPNFPANPNFTLIGQWLWDGTAWAPATLGDEVFAYITAAKILTGVLGVGVQITVGDPTGPHTVIDGTRGLVAQLPGSGGGDPAEVARFGATSGGRDPETGRVTWSIDERGHASLTSASVEADFTVGGEDIRALLADSAGNVIDRYSGTLGANLSPIGDGEVGIVEINGWLTAGRIYELSHRLPWAANDAADVQAIIRPIWTGPSSGSPDVAPAPVVTGSPQTVTAFYQTAAVALIRNSNVGTCLFEPTATGRHRFLLAIRKGFGTGNITVNGDRDIEFWLTDRGPKPPGAGGTVSRGGGALAGGAPPPPPSSPKVTRTDTWVSAWSRSWRQNGSVSFNGPMYQGYGDSFNGVQVSSVGFPDLTPALAGSTIHRVEIFLHAEHWYSFAGGTAGIGFHGSLGLPATFPGIEAYFQVPGWKRNEGRWIDVTGWGTGLAFGGIRGISLSAPLASTSSQYYGRFSGHNGYKWPAIRIKYTK